MLYLRQDVKLLKEKEVKECGFPIISKEVLFVSKILIQNTSVDTKLIKILLTRRNHTEKS